MIQIILILQIHHTNSHPLGYSGYIGKGMRNTEQVEGSVVSELFSSFSQKTNVMWEKHSPFLVAWGSPPLGHVPPVCTSLTS